jgi:hypothetical protein
VKPVLFVLVALLALAALGLPRPATAASRVVLLRSGSADALARQAETLLAAELRASGFEVLTRERAPGLELRADIDAAAIALRPIAVMAIAATAGAAAEIWLSDRVTGKLVIRRIEAGTEGDPAASLALRAVELLRGSLLEITVEESPAPTPRPAPPADVARFVATTAPDHRAWFVEGLGLSLGGALFATPSAAGITYAPALRLSYGGRRSFCLRLSVVAPGSAGDASVHDGASLLGTAHLRQDLALLELVRSFRRDARLQPFASVGGGAHQVRVSGTGGAPIFPDRRGRSVGAVATAGAGVALRLGNRAALVVEASALAGRSTEITVAGLRAARVGPLTFVGGAALMTGF